ncbi:hypothetical protein AAG906_029742 [Vitis piasezkii]
MRQSLLFKQKKAREVSCLNPRIWKAQLWLLTKGVIKRLAILITKRLIDQELQTVKKGITYGALTTKSLDIHRRNARNFMVSQQHPTKNGITMEGNKGIMGKPTCPLGFNQAEIEKLKALLGTLDKPSS